MKPFKGVLKGLYRYRIEDYRIMKEKSVKSPDDFNVLRREVSKYVIETPLEGELADPLGFEK